MAKKIKKNKKDVYPSKKTINLYFKDDKTSKPSTIMLYCMFALVVLLASAKLFVYDVWAELEEQKVAYESNERRLQQYIDKLSGYSEIRNQYNRYSFDYLHDDEKLCDRMALIEMIDATIGKEAHIIMIYLSGDKLIVEFEGVDLEQTAILTQRIESYDIVSEVTIVDAGLSSKEGVHSGKIQIILQSGDDEKGGKQ